MTLLRFLAIDASVIFGALAAMFAAGIVAGNPRPGVQRIADAATTAAAWAVMVSGTVLVLAGFVSLAVYALQGAP